MEENKNQFQDFSLQNQNKKTDSYSYSEKPVAIISKTPKNKWKFFLITIIVILIVMALIGFNRFLDQRELSEKEMIKIMEEFPSEDTYSLEQKQEILDSLSQ